MAVETETVHNISFKLLPDELWWGGGVADGWRMPYGVGGSYARDLRTLGMGVCAPGILPEGSSQSAPLLLSTCGRVIHSKEPFAFYFDSESLKVEGNATIEFCTASQATLQAAYRLACHRYFPPSNRTIDLNMLRLVQYNTWIEMPYHPTQEGVLRYAQSMLDAGMPAGVLMIDDLWARDYGDWRFDEAAFPDASSMIHKLHELGFAVMLWIVPFVSADSAVFRELEQKGFLIRDKHGMTAIRRWWNGLSALIDVSNPNACDWLGERLALLQNIGVDGFKFDAGDLYNFAYDDQCYQRLTPHDMCRLWAQFGTRYAFNEFRACWDMGAQPLAQRLRDKPAVWGGPGIGSLVAEMLAQSMLGYAFVCPDMIGGGDVNSIDHDAVDQEFFVRYTQVAALAPMMQFSIAPSRVLDEVHTAAVRQALHVRSELMPLILRLANEHACYGEPILRPLAYHSQEPQCQQVNDEFLIGDSLLVAPCLEPNARSRRVVIPEGVWVSDIGERVQGPAVLETPCPLDRIIRFTKEQ